MAVLILCLITALTLPARLFAVAGLALKLFSFSKQAFL